MEIDIDPLSMLEQTMQIDDCSVNADCEEDVVCLTDEQEEEVVVLDEDSNHSTDTASESPVNLNLPIIIGTVPNGAVVFDPDSQSMAMVMDPNVTQSQAPVQDDAGSFGEHFLVSSSSFASNPVLTYPENADSPPIVTYPRMNGKTRTPTRCRRPIPKNRAKRGKSGFCCAGVSDRRTPTNNSVTVTKLSPAATLIGQKLLSSANHIKTLINNKKSPAPKCVVANSSSSLNQKLVSNVKRLSCVSQEEQTYRFKMYDDVEKVLRSNLDCTVCGAHIGCSVDLKVFLVTHPLLKVLSCTKCRENYCNKDWTVGPENKDIRCRWCSLPASKTCALFNCSNCPFAFCEKCISRNYCRNDVRLIRGNPKWLCYVCQMVPLYYLRATCWALGLYISNISRKQNRNNFKNDASSCCKSKSPCINLIEDEESDINLIEDEESEVQEVLLEKPIPAKTVPCKALSSRLDVMFSSINTIKNAVTLNLTPNINCDNLEEFVSSLNISLAKIGRNVESCLEYIEKWRVFSLNKLKQQEEAEKRILELQKMDSNGNGSQDYTYLLKKFNIKPCRVVLERLEGHCDRQETSQPPNFFLSLLPQPSEEINVIDDDDDDEIICLDD